MSCNVRCVPVRSRWVRQFILTSRCTLAVWFKNGVCVEYPGTSQPWFSRALAAPSPGHYIHQFLYKKMPYRVIRPPCPPSTPPISTPCCPAGIPALLHATITNTQNTPCAPTTIPLAYNAGTGRWAGSGPFGTCGHDIALQFYCPIPSGPGACNQLVLDVHWPDGCSLDQSGQLPQSCSCSPLSVAFPLNVPVPCGGNLPAPQILITVTL